VETRDKPRRNARAIGRALIGGGAVVLVLAAATAWGSYRDDESPCLTGDDTGVLTPYRAQVSPGTYVQGATLDLPDPADLTGLPAVLATMRDDYRINTINVYGLETWTESQLTTLFEALRAAGMAIALRLEWYDQPTFAFRPEDAGRVVEAYQTLLEVAARPENHALVTYLMLNMPVDDPQVQQRLGGVDSGLSRERQAAYAAELVRTVRARAGTLRVFLGLFYGWDGSYAVPSYSASDPDGYVLTNYSYPGAHVSVSSTVTQIIDEPRLSAVMKRALAQTGNKPLIVEYGFQTLAYQDGNKPDQTAGLVPDANVKKKALAETTSFYCRRYPDVIGTMYFGYNVLKAEGSPARRLDFALRR
jgi:hypothetical protein